MNILRKFTTKNLKLNKKRTIVTIIGIMLSTALVCAVAGMVSSTQQTLINTIKNTEGDYHVTFKNVTKEQISIIEKCDEIQNSFITKNLGYAKLEESKNNAKPYVYVMEYDKKALQKNGLQLKAGRMPENSNEIVISNHIIENGRVSLKVGDTLKLNIGIRTLIEDGTKLEQNNPYQTKDMDTMKLSEEKELEEIINTSPKTYKIVGIIERPNYTLEGFSAPGYTVISYIDDMQDLEDANISVTYKEPKDYSEITNQIVNTIKEETNIELKTTSNTDLLRFEGAMSENTMQVLYGIAAVVIVIIVVSSVFVIRNSFSISVSEKTKQFGMLSSIGATKKQIKKTVLLEGILIGLIAIPLGILCGIIAVNILIIIVNYLLGDMLNNTSFVYSVPILPILISIIVSSITIYLSCIIPAKRASKISPIEAIRGNTEIKIKAKKIKISKLTKKIFGIGGVIASKNLKRNKKKYRTTVISIVVSISILISLSSFLEYGMKMTGMYYTDLGYNVTIYRGNEEIYKEIAKLSNIKDYSYSFTTSADLDINKYGSEYGKKILQKNVEMMKEYPEEEINYKNSITIVLLNNEYFKSFVKSLGIKETNLKNIAILEDDEMEYREDKTKKLQNIYNIKEGDNIHLNIQGKEISMQITKRDQKRPMGYESTYSEGGYIFVSEDFIENKQGLNLSTININSSDATKLENELIDLKNENEKYSEITISNLEYYAKQEQRFILLISIFLYGFIIVITLIGVTNIFNTISTNMLLRSKEFANLKSIGMTSKEFNKMIRLESILYGLKALIIGIPIGLIGSFAIYRSFANSIDFGFLVPWQTILISIIFVFIIVGATMKYSLSKINKQNIIETIRQDNI